MLGLKSDQIATSYDVGVWESSWLQELWNIVDKWRYIMYIHIHKERERERERKWMVCINQPSGNGASSSSTLSGFNVKFMWITDWFYRIALNFRTYPETAMSVNFGNTLRSVSLWGKQKENIRLIWNFYNTFQDGEKRRGVVLSPANTSNFSFEPLTVPENLQWRPQEDVIQPLSK